MDAILTVDDKLSPIGIFNTAIFFRVNLAHLIRQMQSCETRDAHIHRPQRDKRGSESHHHKERTIV